MGLVKITELALLWGKTSDTLEKRRSVPKGNCLRPLLVKLNTLDFPRCVKYCTPHLYGDYVQVHLSYYLIPLTIHKWQRRL